MKIPIKYICTWTNIQNVIIEKNINKKVHLIRKLLEAFTWVVAKLFNNWYIIIFFLKSNTRKTIYDHLCHCNIIIFFKSNRRKSIDDHCITQKHPGAARGLDGWGGAYSKFIVWKKSHVSDTLIPHRAAFSLITGGRGDYRPIFTVCSAISYRSADNYWGGRPPLPPSGRAVPGRQPKKSFESVQIYRKDAQWNELKINFPIFVIFSSWVMVDFVLTFRNIIVW